MKHSVKQRLKERKHNDIFADYLKMFKRNMHIDVIYQKLEKKYYLDQGTIYRVVLEKKGVLKDNKHVRNVT